MQKIMILSIDLYIYYFIYLSIINKQKSNIMTNLEQAAKFYLLFNGKNGTKKQIEKLINTMSEAMILKLATDRGYEANL